MHNDIFVDGQRTQEQLRKLQDYHCLEKGSSKEGSGISRTILKILSIVVWIFSSLMVFNSLPAEMAFILITLISVAALAVIAGSDKIVAIFPSRIWLWSHRPSPIFYNDPPIYQTRTYSIYDPRGWFSKNRGHSIYSDSSSSNYASSTYHNPSSHSTYSSSKGHQSSSHRNSSGHSIYSSTSWARNPSKSTTILPSSSTPLSQPQNIYGGGGHATQTHIAAETNQIAPGGGHHLSTTTPGGEVIPGNRKRRD